MRRNLALAAAIIAMRMIFSHHCVAAKDGAHDGLSAG